MAVDAPTPLATATQFGAGAFADLSKNMQPGVLDQFMLDATRECEDFCTRRLAPFTGLIESQRLDAGDLDDYGSTGMPLPMAAQMGLDYANALNIGQMVRHCWVREIPARYQELWVGAISQIQIYWPYQSTPYVVPPSAVQYDVDTGHIRFTVGTFVPFGSTGVITYSGGYATVPSALSRACIYKAAAMAILEFDPMLAGNHDAGALSDAADMMLVPYVR